MLVGLFLSSSCKQTSNVYLPKNYTPFSYAEAHMGMIFHITLYHTNKFEADQAAEAAFLRVAELNSIMSDYDPESELSRFMQAPTGTEVPLSQDLFEVLSIAQKLAHETDGAFDPTLGPLTKLWRVARKTKTLPPPEQVLEAQSRCGYQKLILNKKKQSGILSVAGMGLDLGGIGKGFASDKALAVLKEHGIQSALVAASGDIAVSNPPPNQSGWSIQVETFTESESDSDAGSYIIYLKNAAISTSGDVNQFVEIAGNRYSHIVDSKTGLGLTHRIGATVICPQATYSDALATIVCIKGEEKAIPFLKKYPRAQARIVYMDAQGDKQYLNSIGFPQPRPKDERIY